MRPLSSSRSQRSPIKLLGLPGLHVLRDEMCAFEGIFVLDGFITNDYLHRPIGTMESTPQEDMQEI